MKLYCYFNNKVTQSHNLTCTVVSVVLFTKNTCTMISLSLYLLQLNNCCEQLLQFNKNNVELQKGISNVYASSKIYIFIQHNAHHKLFNKTLFDTGHRHSSVKLLQVLNIFIAVKRSQSVDRTRNK